MATIRKRLKKDGSFSYMAQIRIARRGQPDFTESRTFPKKAMAEEWAKRRELELMQPGGILTAKWRGVTMSDAFERPKSGAIPSPGLGRLSCDPPSSGKAVLSAGFSCPITTDLQRCGSISLVYSSCQSSRATSVLQLLSISALGSFRKAVITVERHSVTGLCPMACSSIA